MIIFKIYSYIYIYVFFFFIISALICGKNIKNNNSKITFSLCIFIKIKLLLHDNKIIIIMYNILRINTYKNLYTILAEKFLRKTT